MTWSYCKRIPTPDMAKRFRKTTRYTRSRSYSRPVRRSRRYQRKATSRMASVQYHTFTLVNQIGVTKDSGKNYSRVAWTAPNTSGVISPLMALNDDPLFKRLLSASDEFKIYSVNGTAFTGAPSGGTIQHIVTFSDRNTLEDDLTPTLVNSYGSAKHTVINSNGQSVVYWTPLRVSGTIEGVTWGKQSQSTLEGELP